MQYQTFRGADVKEAVGRIRTALGPNAVIGPTRRVTNGRAGGLGQSFVEVMAARPPQEGSPWTLATEVPITEFSPPTVQVEKSQRIHAAVTSATLPQRAERPRSRVQDKPTPPRATQDMEQELRVLRAMVEELNASRPPRERAMAMLISAGFENRVARELAVGMARNGRQGREAMREVLEARIAERLRVMPDLLTTPKKKLIACVGPTGAGKTTTLAKLAARARLDHGRSVGVLSLDTFRVGAVEQWQRYAQLIGVAFNAVRRRWDFEQAVSRSSCDLILVDTSGRGATDTEEDWPLAQYLAEVTRQELHVLVVLPAWLRSKDASGVVDMYADVRPTGAVMTKLDETTRFGGVLDAILGADLPATYLCDGPRVPEDIHAASVPRLVSGLLTGAD